jgi:hypothetical protein
MMFKMCIHQKKGSAAANKANAEAQRLRSMMNVAATQVKTSQKRLERGLEGLADAKVLLHRAVRIYNQQRAFLPLFRLLSGVDESVLPTECTLNYVLTALIFLMRGTFDQKLNLLLGLYDVKAEGIYTSTFIVSVINLCQQSLHKLRCIPFLLDKEVITNMVERGFMDLQLRPHREARVAGQPIEEDFLTQYETKMLLLTMFSRSCYLTKMLDTTAATQALASDESASAVSTAFNPANNSLIMSTFQRNNMHALGLLRNGLIMPTTAKYRLHYEVVKYRASLEPQHKQVYIHSCVPIVSIIMLSIEFCRRSTSGPWQWVWTTHFELTILSSWATRARRKANILLNLWITVI